MLNGALCHQEVCPGKRNYGPLRLRHRQWIPAFAGMTTPGTGFLNIVIPAKAGIQLLPMTWTPTCAGVTKG
jgi:hypothetical protein